MNLLAISTSTPRWSVWLHRADGWQRAIHAEAGRGTGQRASLTQMVWDLLAAADLKPGQLQRIVCDIGPGSFTGLRQGLALARAVAWAHGIPTRGVSSLEAMALVARDQLAKTETCVVALPARSDVDFIGFAGTERALNAAEAAGWWPSVRPSALAIAPTDHGRSLARLAVSHGARLLDVWPDAETMGRLALAQPDAMSPLTPRYLAVSEAEHHAGVSMPEATLPALDRAMAPRSDTGTQT